MSRPPEFQNKALILGVRIDNRPLEFVLQRIDHYLNSDSGHKIYTPNPEIVLKAEEDEDYRDILNRADINIPDGIGLKLGASILGEELEERVTGSDLTRTILEKYNEKGSKVFILLRQDSLSSEDDLKKLFKERYPSWKIKIDSVEKENCYNCDDVLNNINAFEPQFLFVALGAPMQETWIDKYLKLVPSVKIALGIGGSFDFLTGKIHRAPAMIRDLGFEWLYRLYQEPKRLSRIKNATIDFLLACHRWKKGMEENYRANVLGVVKNKAGQYLIQKNSRLPDHWQFPQGGVDAGEAGDSAVVREVGEELGIDISLLKVIKELPETHRYEWPDYAKKLRGLRGQEQRAYLLEFSGTDSDIHIENSHEVEAWRWVDKANLFASLHPVRREFVEKLLKHL